MRKQGKILLWSAYFDSNRTRMQGRRVAKSLAITSPKLEEIQNAIESIGLQAEVVFDAKYPKSPWQKAGYILIPKKGLKAKTMREIAKKLVNMRK